MPFETVARETEVTRKCDCCGRPIYLGCGELTSGGRALADYWYQWAEGHEARFYLAVSPRDSSGNCVEDAGVSVLSARIDAADLVYSVIEPEQSPWSDFGAFGKVLPRDEVLNSSDSNSLFLFVDAIAANEPRLAARILECANGCQ
jgi:hypothetical protein